MKNSHFCASRSSGYLSILSFWRKWALQASTTVIAELFVCVKILYSGVGWLLYAINIHTAKAASHTRVQVYGFRMRKNFVLSAKSTKNTKINCIRKFLRLHWVIHVCLWVKSSNGKWLKIALEKTLKYRYFSLKWSWRNEFFFFFRANSSRHLIYVHFCVWLGTLYRSLVVEGSVIRSWFFFLSKHCTVVALAARKRNEGPEWTNLPWRALQKTRNWPTCA